MAVEPRPRDRSYKINVRVSQHVHEFLMQEAESRGIAMSNLCTHIIGEWKTVIEDRRRPHKQLEDFTGNIEAQMQDMFQSLPELLQMDVEPPDPERKPKK